MAEIVELTRPDNVRLVRGAMQNWRDSDDPGAASPLLSALVARALAGPSSVLVVGPHDPAISDAVVASGARVTFVVRSIPDAASLGSAHPSASVLCGQLTDALAEAGAFDLVVALDDLTRTQSLDADAVAWRELAGAVVAALAPGGRLLLAVENDLSLGRLLGVRSPATADTDADWTPLATWDATRPRTRDQLATTLADLGLPGAVDAAFGEFRRPDAVGHGLDRSAPLADLASSWVSRPVFAARSIGLAGRVSEHCAGWVVDSASADGYPELRLCGRSADTAASVATWREAAGSLTDGAATVPAPGASATLLTALVAACTDDDLPTIRRLLAQWRAWLDGRATVGLVGAARFDNVLLANPWTPLVASASPLPLEQAAWDAVAHFYAVVRSEGVRTPWPTTMHPRTVLETIGVLAGLTPPDDLDRYLTPLPIEPTSRQDLVASVERLQAENAAAWARFHWGEARYAVEKARDVGHRLTTKAARDAGKLVGRLTRRGASGR